MTPPRSRCEEDATGSISNARSCAVWFSQLESAVRELSKQVEGMSFDVKELSKQVIIQGQSLGSAWDVIKADLLPNVREADNSINEAIAGHVEACPAHKRAMRRAEGNNHSSDTNISVSSFRGESSKFTIPKWIVYLGTGVGIALSVGAYALYRLLS